MNGIKNSWLDETGNHITILYDVQKIQIPGYSQAITLHAYALLEHKGCIQRNWSKAWTTDENDSLVNVPSLTTWLYGLIDGSNQTRESTVVNGNYVEQGPFESRCYPDCINPNPSQLCTRALCTLPLGRRMETPMGYTQ